MVFFYVFMLTPKQIVTEQGSIYRWLPNGTTQRFRVAINTLLEPQDAIVFIPPYQLLKISYSNQNAFERIFWENELKFEQLILKYAQTKWHIIHIVSCTGKRLETNQEISWEKNIYLAFWKKWDTSYHFHFPVSKEAKIWYYTFDTRTYTDGTWEQMTERHIWNKVREIIY